MTHEEEGEMQHDISKLRDQDQRNSLSQKVIQAKMDGLKKGMEAKMDDLNKGVKAKMNDVKAKMEGKMEDLKTDLTKLLQERILNGKNVVEETHEENKRNVNHDFIDSNVGLKTHHVPKINMRKFDGKDPGTWIL